MSEETNTTVTEPKAEEQIELQGIPEGTGTQPDSGQGITKEEALAAGWTEDEVKRGEERGLIQKPKEEEKPQGGAQPADGGEGGGGQGDQKPLEEKPKEDEGKADKLVERRNKKDYELAPEEEAKFEESFGKGSNVHGLYHGMKSQRSRAQRAETERDFLKMQMREKEKEFDKLNERLGRLERFGKEGVDGENPDEQPVTMKQLKEWEEQREKKKAEMTDTQRKTEEVRRSAMMVQEERAREEYPDYDDVVKAGTELVEKHIKTLEGPAKKKVSRLLQDLGVAAAQADKIGDDAYNACDIAYDLGQFAKTLLRENNSGDKTEEGSKSNGQKPERTNGGLTPEQRIIENTQRRPSSASVQGGGGSRLVSVADVTMQDLNNMTADQRVDFRKKHPKIWDKLVRG